MASSKWKQIEDARGKPIKQILIELFELHGRDEQPQKSVAAELGVSQPTISLWLKALQLRPAVTLVDAPAPGTAGADRGAAEQLLPGFQHVEMSA